MLKYIIGGSKKMKKKNMIIIGVISLILVVAVGYAIFSDTLTINGSATAKGDFSITTTCTPGITNEGFLNANLIYFLIFYLLYFLKSKKYIVFILIRILSNITTADRQPVGCGYTAASSTLC